MATISSHVLDSMLGTHAAGIRVQCIRHEPSGVPTVLFDKHADEQGRISEQVELSENDVPVVCELVFHSREYFQQTLVVTTLNTNQ